MDVRGVRTDMTALVVLGVALGLWAVATDRSAFVAPAPAGTAADFYVSTVPTPEAGPTATASATLTPVPFVAPRPADRPASFGERLGVVTEPPPDTLVLAASNVASAGATYDTVFAPYGFAAREGDLRDPSNGSGADALVIGVIGSTPRAGTGARLALSDRNVLVGLTPTTLGKVVTGGQYLGTIVLVKRGNGLVPVLTMVMVPRRH